MTDNNNEPINRKIRSFILRQGRYTNAQKLALENHWNTYGIDYSEGFINFEQVFSNANPVTLEIGFGNGDSLLQQCQQYPDENFIGIEVHGPGVGHLIHRAHESEIKNLKIIRHDAIEVLNNQIADESLASLQLFFPDPWHKKKHNKRRIVQPIFVQRVREKLIHNGILHMATDWQHYAEQMLALTDSAKGYTNLAGQSSYSTHQHHRTETKFERRGLKLGHGIWDLLYQKTP